MVTPTSHNVSFYVLSLPCYHTGIIYCINALVTQHIKSVALLQLVTLGYMFRLLPGLHQANKEKCC